MATVDEDGDRGFSATRWLAWATAGLLVIGAVSVGTVKDRNMAADQGIVAAAGSGVAGIDAATTTSTEPPTTVAAPTTVAVTSPTKVAPTTAVTVRTTTTTTAQPPRTTPTSRPPATTTTAAAGSARSAMVTVANDYTHAVILRLSGREFTLAPGQQQGPFEYALEPNGNDSIEITLVGLPECGLGDAGGLFAGPGRYRLAVVASPGACTNAQGQPFPGPAFTVKPA